MQKWKFTAVLLLLVICTGCGNTGAADINPAVSPIDAGGQQSVSPDSPDTSLPISENSYVVSESGNAQIVLDHENECLYLVKDGAPQLLPDIMYRSLDSMHNEDPYSYYCFDTYTVQWFDGQQVFIANYILNIDTLDYTELDGCILFHVSGNDGIFLADGQYIKSGFDGGLVGNMTLAKKLCLYSEGTISTLYEAEEGRYLFIENYAEALGDLEPADGAVSLHEGAADSLESLQAQIISNGAEFLEGEDSSLLDASYETDEGQNQEPSDTKQYIESKYPFTIHGIKDGHFEYSVTLSFFLDQIEPIEIGID